jgi:hypothetical protein
VVVEDRWEEGSCCRIRSHHFRRDGRRRGSLGQDIRTWLGIDRSKEQDERRKEEEESDSSAGGDAFVEGRSELAERRLDFGYM